METCRQEKRQNKLNIIVVDDEAVIREGMRRILAAEGYQVETSADGRTALEKMVLPQNLWVIKGPIRV